ncbi:MAG: ZIP family metal transporter [Actinobacteria bacterium]|nr:ZIP family metal transporter [Actinomycetota bacterium]
MGKQSVLFIFSLVVFLMGGIGGYFALKIGEGKSLRLKIGLGLGSGFMLSIGLIDLLPEAVSESKNAYIMAIVGFAFFYVIEQVFKTHFCPSTEHNCPEHGKSLEPIGFFSFAGISIHSLIDGLAFGGALASSFKLGILVAIAVIAHKIPDGFCLGTLLLCKKYSRKIIVLLLSLFAIMTPLGALITYYGFAYGLSVNLGLVLGFTAGSFLYVAVADMLPEAHEIEGITKGENNKIILSVLFGILVGCLSIFIE